MPLKYMPLPKELVAPVLSDGGTSVLFHDAQDINKVKAEIDMDNVVLTDA